MAGPKLSALADRISETPPEERATHLANLDLLRQLANFARSQVPPDVTSCLLAVVHVLEALTGKTPGLDRVELHRLACELVRAVGDTLEGFEAPPPEAAQAPAPSPCEAQLGEVQSDPLLGQILIKLGRINEEQLEGALKFHREKGLPLGECLLVTGICPPEHVLDALKLQQKLREGPVYTPPTDAPAAGAAAGEATGDAAILVRQEMFLGEVLLGVGMINNEQLERAMHLHHHDGVPVGDALSQIAGLTAEQIRHGLELKQQLEGLAKTSA